MFIFGAGCYLPFTPTFLFELRYSETFFLPFSSHPNPSLGFQIQISTSILEIIDFASRMLKLVGASKSSESSEVPSNEASRADGRPGRIDDSAFELQ